MKMSISGH